MTTIVYTRESKGSAESVARQRDDGLELCDRRGYTDVIVLGDADKSAAGKKARPDFDKLIQLIEAGVVNVVVAWSWDRLERNRRDGLRLIEACMAHNVTVALVRGVDLDCSTPGGRLSADILTSVARHEIEQKSDRMARAQLQAAQAGRPAARRAFGYTGDAQIHPTEGPAVAEAFARLLAGGSIVGIVQWLNNRQLWTTGNKPWTAPGVRKMLKNSRYCAVRTYQGREVGPGNWPAIVPVDVYRATVAILDDPERLINVGGRARKHLGAGLYLCSRCDDGTTVATAYRTGKVRAYQCRASKHLSRVAAPIDHHIIEMIAARLRRADMADLLAEAAPDLTPLRTEATALRKRIRQLGRDLSIDEETLAVRDAALRERLVEVEAELDEAGSHSSALARLALSPNPEQAWRDTTDVAARQAVIRELCVVTLLPGPTGRRAFDPATVRVEPREMG